MFNPPEKVIQSVVRNERLLIADFVRLARCLMSTEKIASAIQDGSYLETMNEKEKSDDPKTTG